MSESDSAFGVRRPSSAAAHIARLSDYLGTVIPAAGTRDPGRSTGLSAGLRARRRHR